MERSTHGSSSLTYKTEWKGVKRHLIEGVEGVSVAYIFAIKRNLIGGVVYIVI
jgi:hypothetical protein